MPEANVPKYDAVPDPDTGDMTYWTRDKQGELRAWPPRAYDGPPMPSKKELHAAEDMAAVGRTR